MNNADSTVRKEALTEKEIIILKVFTEVIPELNVVEKEKLLAFGEGMLFMKTSDKIA